MRDRKGFTLVELMIAIILLGLVIGFLLGTLGGVRKNSQALENKNLILEKKSKMAGLLQDDVISSSVLDVVESDNYISLEMRTSSSIFEINNPYVRWFVDPKKKILIRSESAKDYLPPYDSDKLFEIHLNEVAEKCDWFKGYAANDKKSFLVGLKCEGDTDFIEIATPQYTTESNSTKP